MLTLYVHLGTYQEAILSRRRLYFTNARVYLEYNESTFHEDEYNYNSEFDFNRSKERIPSRRYSDYSAYAQHVENYTSRFLSLQTDVYAAFAGITNALFGPGLVHYGLPLAHFDHALHWFSSIDQNEPRQREQNGVLFPTWS
jgi:hypothetical protein